MGKLLLNLGYLDLADTRYYVTDANVIDQVSKADTSNPNNNNEIITGKSTWTFSATIFKNEALSLAPGNYDDARLVFGGQLWYGPITIIQTSLIGRIDNAVTYNITGEFRSPSEHLELIWQDIGAGDPINTVLDSWQWMDDDGDDIPNGAVQFGSSSFGVWDIISTLHHRRYRLRNSLGGPVGVQYNQVNWESGELYRFYIRYDNITSISGFHRIYVGASAFISLGQASGTYTLTPSDTATSAWDRLSFQLWGDLSFPAISEYYFMFAGKIINSI